MSGPELYGALIRCGGTVLLVFSVFDLYHVIAKLLSFDSQSRVSMSEALLAMGTYFLLGMVLSFGARWLTRIVYRGNHPPNL